MDVVRFGYILLPNQITGKYVYNPFLTAPDKDASWKENQQYFPTLSRVVPPFHWVF